MSQTPPPLPSSARPTSVRHWVVLALLAMAVLLYLDRVCVSVAQETIRQDLKLKDEHIDWFLGLFFITYAVGQVPTGWLSDRYGARLMLVAYIVLWSLFTAMFGIAAGFVSLMVARAGCGLAQAGGYPTAGSVISRWVPFSARGTASSFVAVGGRIGGAIAPILTALLIVSCVPSDVSLLLEEADLREPGRVASLTAPVEPPATGEVLFTQPTAAGKHVWSLLEAEEQTATARVAAEARRVETLRKEGERAAKENAPRDTPVDPPQFSAEDLATLRAALNRLIQGRLIHEPTAFAKVDMEREAKRLLAATESGKTDRLNRLLLEGVFPGGVRKLYIHGWRPVMMIYGAVGVFVAAAFWFVYRNQPAEHPWVNQAERDLIVAGRPKGMDDGADEAGQIPLAAMVGNLSMWLNCGAQMATNIGWVFVVTSLPKFLDRYHHVPIEDIGLMSTVVLVIGIAGMLCGGLFTDKLVPRVGLKWGRRLPLVSTRFAGALAYLACAWSLTFDPDTLLGGPWAAAIAIGLMCFAQDLGNPSLWAYCQDVGGKNGGSVLGWGNMWGNFAAGVAPRLYGLILGTSPELAEWRTLFLVCAASFMLSGLCALGIDASKPLVTAKTKKPTQP